MKILLIIVLMILLFIIFSSCKVASRCSREEEIRDKKENIDLFK